MVRMSVDEFKKRYPNLWREITENNQYVLKKEDPLRGFEPGIIDFIRRAETKEEALEVIDYFEKRQEITPKLANELRSKIEKYGPRYFGPKKQPGYYLKKYYLGEEID